MNLTPPIAMRFDKITSAQVANARAGICPHCPPPSQHWMWTLESKHVSGEIEFKQCSRCKVVVALERL